MYQSGELRERMLNRNKQGGADKAEWSATVGTAWYRAVDSVTARAGPKTAVAGREFLLADARCGRSRTFFRNRLGSIELNRVMRIDPRKMIARDMTEPPPSAWFVVTRKPM